MLFEEAVEMDEEFAHDGGESDFVSFTAGDETLIKSFEDGVEAGGGQGSHVEGASNTTASALDAAQATSRAAIAIEGSKTGQGGDLAPGKGAQLRHVGQKAGDSQRANAADFGQELGFGGKKRMGFDQGLDQPDEVIDLLVEVADVLAQGLEADRIGGLLETGVFPGPVLDELAAPGDEGIELDHGGIGLWRQSRSELAAIIGQEPSIDGIGLGPQAFGPGEVAGLAGVEHGEANAGLVKGLDEGPMVRPGGLTHDLHGTGDFG